MRNMASSFFMLGKIKTTEAKAKALRPYVEKCITRAKTPTLHNRRMLLRTFSRSSVNKLIEKANEMKDRSGGYTRIVKLGQRKSDGAKMAIIELVTPGT